MNDLAQIFDHDLTAAPPAPGLEVVTVEVGSARPVLEPAPAGKKEKAK